MNMMGNGMMMSGILMPVLWLLVLTLLVVGVVFVARWLLDDSKPSKGRDDAMRIVQERFARGEIAANEFRAIKEELSA
ncbi:MAG TPA: hypothetical protein VF171_02135 [Trueperaceae bacterium]